MLTKLNESKQAGLISEILGLVNDPADLLKAKLSGQLHWIKSSATDYRVKPETWVLKAQLGTVEKLQHLMTQSGLEQDLSLIALARNIFENLIWLKLFNEDKNYGLIFYRHLLQQQLDSQLQVIEKAREEIDLFKRLAIEDVLDFDLLLPLIDVSTTEEEKALLVSDFIREHSERIDLKARSVFSIYADQAKCNGYAYQAHLIESQVIPHHQEHINTINDHMDELLSSMPMDISPTLKAELFKKNPHWNWRCHASSLGMESQYKFLYALTSRLLHSTSMSLATPAELSPQEKFLLLDYLCLSIKGLCEEIQKFEYVGKMNTIRFPSKAE